MEKSVSELIRNRFSPMIFDDKVITQNQIETLLTSATLSASSYNSQPWIFIYGQKGSKDYEVLRDLLSDYNKKWTITAPVLMLGIAKIKNEKGENNYYAMYDVGQAVSSMAIQASSMGLQIHQMGGYDINKAIEVLSIPSDYIPASIFAIGYPGDKSKLYGHFKERASEPRVRKPFNEISGGTNYFQI